MADPVDPIISSSGPAHRAIKSSIYVLHEHVHGRKTVASDTNACYQMLLRHRPDIEARIPALAQELEAYEKETSRARYSYAEWFREFTTVYTSGALHLPTRRQRKGVYILASRAARTDWSDLMWTVAALIDEGTFGITQGELKDLMGSDSNGPTGALSKLHAYGLISRLEARR